MWFILMGRILPCGSFQGGEFCHVVHFTGGGGGIFAFWFISLGEFYHVVYVTGGILPRGSFYWGVFCHVVY